MTNYDDLAEALAIARDSIAYRIQSELDAGAVFTVDHPWERAFRRLGAEYEHITGFKLSGHTPSAPSAGARTTPPSAPRPPKGLRGASTP